MKSLKKLGELADRFAVKLTIAQSQEFDYSLVESVRKALGPAITADVGNILNSRAVSSIPIRVSYNKPNVSFIVSSKGSDSAAVDKEVTDLLNKKYALKIAQILSKAKDSSFEFGLLTVE